jgi:hypothetical protein
MSKFGAFIARRWKALAPLALYGISEAVRAGFNVDSPSGTKAFIWAAVTAIVVHQVPNRPPA